MSELDSQVKEIQKVFELVKIISRSEEIEQNILLE